MQSARMTRCLPLAAIGSFHAHIYVEGAAQRATALALREQIGERFRVALGRVHDVPVGPHARPMYQAAFDAETFGNFVPWLMLNRQGLVVFVHPNTRNERRDHPVHALWMGEVQEIVGPEHLSDDIDAEVQREPNTQPTLAPQASGLRVAQRVVHRHDRRQDRAHVARKRRAGESHHRGGQHKTAGDLRLLAEEIGHLPRRVLQLGERIGGMGAQ
jgi:aromatic ring-cleaving dioxygenase